MDELTLDELTLFRDFRSDRGGPSSAETTAARARLLDAIADESFAPSRRMSWVRRMPWLRPFARTRFWAPLAAAAAVTAIAVTVSLLAAYSPPATPAPKPSQPAPTHRHPRHQASHPVHRGNGSSKLAPNQGQAGQAGGKSAGKGAASAAGAPGSPGGTGPGVSPAPSTPTTTVLTASIGRVSPGQTVALTAIVSDQAGDNLSSGGSVSFFLSPQPSPGAGAPAATIPVCSRTSLTYNAAARDNVAACSYTPAAADEGIYTVTAGYSGYGRYQGSSSGTMGLDVGQPTTTALTVSPAQVSAGQVVTLTATVSGQAGSDLSDGTVEFFVMPNANPGEFFVACSNSGVPMTSSTATCAYTAPATPGTYSVQAVYSGDQQNQGSESNFPTFTVES